MLLDFLRQFPGLTLPIGTFSIAGKDSAEIAGLLEASDRHEVVKAMKMVLGNSLSQGELDIIANRKGQLYVFDRLLHGAEYLQARREQLNLAARPPLPQDA